MNIVLWILQIVLALLCISGGIFQIFKIEELRKGVTAMRVLPRGLWTFLGIVGCLGGLGLIVPAALNIAPGLTPIAAAAVAGHSILISGLYLYYRDFSPMPYSVAMSIMAVFISYGRFELAPI